MGDSLDNTMTKDVTLPSGTATLAFKAWYEIETCWDYAYVRVSTDGGATWTNVATNLSDSAQRERAELRQRHHRHLRAGEALRRASGNPVWVNATADLSAYAGQTVKLQFRYWTDGFVVGRGFEVDDITVNGTLIGGAESTTRAGPSTASARRPGSERLVPRPLLHR